MNIGKSYQHFPVPSSVSESSALIPLDMIYHPSTASVSPTLSSSHSLSGTIHDSVAFNSSSFDVAVNYGLKQKLDDFKFPDTEFVSSTSSEKPISRPFSDVKSVPIENIKSFEELKNFFFSSDSQLSPEKKLNVCNKIKSLLLSRSMRPMDLLNLILIDTRYDTDKTKRSFFVTKDVFRAAFVSCGKLSDYLNLLEISIRFNLFNHLSILNMTNSLMEKLRLSGEDMLNLLTMISDGKISARGRPIYFSSFHFLNALNHAQSSRQLSKMLEISCPNFNFKLNKKVLLKTIAKSLGRFGWSGEEIVSLFDLELKGLLKIDGHKITFDSGLFLIGLSGMQTAFQLLSFFDIIQQRGVSLDPKLVSMSIGKIFNNFKWKGSEVLKFFNLVSNNRLKLNDEVLKFQPIIYRQGIKCLQSSSQLLSLLELSNLDKILPKGDSRFTVSVGESLNSLRWSGLDVVRLIELFRDQKIRIQDLPCRVDFMLFTQSVKNVQTTDQLLRMLEMGGLFNFESYDHVYIIKAIGQAINLGRWTDSEIVKLLKFEHSDGFRINDKSIFFDSEMFSISIEKIFSLPFLLEVLGLINSQSYRHFNVGRIRASIGKSLNSSRWVGSDVVELVKLERFRGLFVHKLPLYFDNVIYSQAIKNVQSVEQLYCILRVMDDKGCFSEDVWRIVSSLGESFNKFKWQSSEMVSLLDLMARKRVFLSGRPLPLTCSLVSQALKSSTLAVDIQTILNIANDHNFFKSNHRHAVKSIADSLNSLRWSGDEILSFFDLCFNRKIFINVNPFIPDVAFTKAAVKNFHSPILLRCFFRLLDSFDIFSSYDFYSFFNFGFAHFVKNQNCRQAIVELATDKLLRTIPDASSIELDMQKFSHDLTLSTLQYFFPIYIENHPADSIKIFFRKRQYSGIGVIATVDLALNFIIKELKKPTYQFVPFFSEKECSILIHRPARFNESSVSTPFL